MRAWSRCAVLAQRHRRLARRAGVARAAAHQPSSASSRRAGAPRARGITGGRLPPERAIVRGDLGVDLDAARRDSVGRGGAGLGEDDHQRLRALGRWRRRERARERAPEASGSTLAHHHQRGARAIEDRLSDGQRIEGSRTISLCNDL